VISEMPQSGGLWAGLALEIAPYLFL
jgi:hypothetical protein